MAHRTFTGSQAGFTLIELVMVIVVIVILAAVAIPRFVDTAAFKAEATARRLQSDVAYAQELAMTRNQPHRVYFNTAPAPAQGYAVVNDANGNGAWGEAGEFAQDPGLGGNLSVTLNAGDYAGVTISATSFTGSFVGFNTLGVPSDGGGTLAATKTVTVSGSGTNRTVTVQPQTGKVSSP